MKIANEKWTVDVDAGIVYGPNMIEDSGPECVALVCCEMRGPEPHQTRTARAALIAAAPELLAVLLDVFKYAFDPHDSAEDYARRNYDDIQALIARAECRA